MNIESHSWKTATGLAYVETSAHKLLFVWLVKFDEDSDVEHHMFQVAWSL